MGEYCQGSQIEVFILLQHTFGFHQELNSDQPLSPCEPCDPEKEKKNIHFVNKQMLKKCFSCKNPLNPSNLALIYCFFMSLPAYQAFQQASLAILQLGGHLYG